MIGWCLPTLVIVRTEAQYGYAPARQLVGSQGSTRYATLALFAVSQTLTCSLCNYYIP